MPTEYSGDHTDDDILLFAYYINKAVRKRLEIMSMDGAYKGTLDSNRLVSRELYFPGNAINSLFVESRVCLNAAMATVLICKPEAQRISLAP